MSSGGTATGPRSSRTPWASVSRGSALTLTLTLALTLALTITLALALALALAPFLTLTLALALALLLTLALALTLPLPRVQESAFLANLLEQACGYHRIPLTLTLTLSP